MDGQNDAREGNTDGNGDGAGEERENEVREVIYRQRNELERKRPKREMPDKQIVGKQSADCQPG